MKILFYFFLCVQDAKSLKIEKLTSAIELGEGPHWNSNDQNLYYVDINGQKVMRYNPATREVTSAYFSKIHL